MSNFPITNNKRSWKIYKPHDGSIGERRVWPSEQDLVLDMERYFNYIEENPKKIQIGHYKGDIVECDVDNVPTKWGFAVFMGIDFKTFLNYQKRYPGAADWFESVISEKIFTGALIGTYNANLASRYLGLADKREVTGNQIVEVNLYIPKVEAPKQIDAPLDEFEDLTWED